MSKDKIALIIAKGLSKGKSDNGDSEDNTTSEDEESSEDMAKDEAAQEVLDAVEAKDASALRAALQAFVEAC